MEWTSELPCRDTQCFYTAVLPRTPHWHVWWHDYGKYETGAIAVDNATECWQLSLDEMLDSTVNTTVS